MARPKPVMELRKPPELEPVPQPTAAAIEAFVAGGPQEVTSVTSHIRDKSTSQHRATVGDFKRATYYLRPDQIRALKLRAVTEDRNLSAVVRDAVDAYLSG
jgi:hypothetical protein